MKAGDEHRTSTTEHRTSKERSAETLFDLEERLLEYAARIIRFVDALPNTKGANHVGGQLLRSGTSPLPNHGEMQAAESINDFIHKLKICLKELRESHRRLRLARRVGMVRPVSKLDPLITETDELTRIFVKSLQSAETRRDSTTRIREDEPPPSMFDVRRSTFDVPPAPPSRKKKAPRE